MADWITRMRELGRLFWRSAKETGESAAELIEQRAQLQRLASQIKRLNREREGLLRQIGVKVYALHGQGKVRNQDVLADCQRIDEIAAEIGRLRQEIERIRLAQGEKGITLPPLEDEAPLDEETPAASAMAGEAQAAVAPAPSAASTDSAKEAEGPAAAVAEQGETSSPGTGGAGDEGEKGPG